LDGLVGGLLRSLFGLTLLLLPFPPERRPSDVGGVNDATR
jgi:hypothetical protein